MEEKKNTKAFCFVLLCFGSFFILFSVLVLVLVLVFLCVFAPLRLCVSFFWSSNPPFEPLRSRLRVDFLWTNRKSEGFGEAVQGVGCRSGIDGMGRLSIAEDFAQTSDIRIGDLGRIAG